MRAVRRRATFDAFRSSEAQRFGGRGTPVRVTFLATLDGDSFDEAEVAFAIDRRFGCAVDRNRARRRIRHVLQDLDAERSLAHGAYLFRPNRSALSCSHERLKSSIEALMFDVAGSSA